MTASDFHGKPVVPNCVKHLDADVVIEVLSRHGINVMEAANKLGVASADLRRLLWARPKLADAAVEIEERRLDLAEKNIYEALTSDDPRRRDAASMFTIRNSHRARRRGWITASTSAAELSVTANAPMRTLTFRWRTSKMTSATPRRLSASGIATRASTRSRSGGATAARRSSTRPAQSLQARTEILATAPTKLATCDFAVQR